VLERRELRFAADERRVEPPCVGGRAGDHVEQAPGGDGLRLPFQHERLDRFRVDRVDDEDVRLRPEKDLARVGRLLQPGGDVDGVAGDQPLRRPGDDLPGIDADPALELELAQGRLHLLRHAHGAQRVVLTHHWHAEHGPDGVADELLHAAAVLLDDRLHPLEVAGQQSLQRLRVDGLAERRRADDVAEHDRHDLPLHARSVRP
jgi:hypothetical protein